MVALFVAKGASRLCKRPRVAEHEHSQQKKWNQNHGAALAGVEEAPRPCVREVQTGAELGLCAIVKGGTQIFLLRDIVCSFKKKDMVIKKVYSCMQSVLQSVYSVCV